METAHVRHIKEITFNTELLLDMEGLKQYLQEMYKNCKIFVGDYSCSNVNGIYNYHVEYILIEL